MKSACHHRLALESLEPRTLLSGNVTAEVIGGDLIITGDDAGNEVIVHEIGIQPGFYVASGGGGTQINGGAGPDVFNNVTGDIRIILNDGDNTLTVHDVDTPGRLRILGYLQ